MQCISCGQEIEQVGNRPKLYCNDRCRQQAFRNDRRNDRTRANDAEVRAIWDRRDSQGQPAYYIAPGQPRTGRGRPETKAIAEGTPG